MIWFPVVALVGLSWPGVHSAPNSADWNRRQECWMRKSGVCVKSSSESFSCPFTGGSTWWKGCPRGYICCVPPRQTEPHKPVTTLSCGYRPSESSEASDYRIVGGFRARLGEFPWQALITNFGRAHCGAAVISPEWILTAAHCLYFHTIRTGFRVKVGLVSNAAAVAELEIAEDFLHKSFDKPDYANDIALLRLATPIPSFNVSVQPICLPRRADRFEDFVCTVSGWGWNGRENPRDLAALNLPTMSHKRCQMAPKSGSSIYKSNLCAGFNAGERDACKGDSGGPFACRRNSGQWSLAGIVSWGEGCALAKEPAVFTRVTSFLDWIERKTGLKWD